MPTYEGFLRHPDELGDAIRQGREILGMSQRELAAELGVTQKWVWELEQGKPGLLMERLFRALRATNVDLVARFTVPDEPPTTEAPTSEQSGPERGDGTP